MNDTKNPNELTAEALASVTGGTRADQLTRRQVKKPTHRRRSGGGVGGLSLRIGVGSGS